MLRIISCRFWKGGDSVKGRAPSRHGQAARPVGGDHLARNLRRQRDGLQEHVRCQADIEHRPARCGADFLDHGRDDVIGLCAQGIGRGDQELAPSARRVVRSLAVADSPP